MKKLELGQWQFCFDLMTKAIAAKPDGFVKSKSVAEFADDFIAGAEKIAQVIYPDSPTEARE